ncbi:MAG: alanine--tRNA ligase, partial [bacterium]
FNDDNPLWVEIWNNVFMQYNKKTDETYEPLKQKNVDTGMGLERTLAIINGFDDNYKTDLFKNLILKIENLSGKTYDGSSEITKAMRIIADHIKAATFIMADDKGIAPSNTDQGYVVRRLIRRAIRYGKQLGVSESSWTKEIAKIVARDYADIYPELQKNINKIIENFNEEEIKFAKTLEQGLKEFEKLSGEKVITGKEAFNLYQTYGFPLEITEELALEKKQTIDKPEFENELKKHQDLSRTASSGMFKGGLADASEATVKYHTTAHLLLAALRKVLGEEVVQKGSNITAERLRFDFAHKEKMTDEEKKKVEDLVNQAIKQNLPVTSEEMTLLDAKNKGAHGIFENKYGELVKVYTIGDEKLYFSKEICGGPHVKQTGNLGNFKIKKEESSSSGVRRIKAILE